MYAGRIVEKAPVKDLFRRTAHALHGGAAGLDPAAGRPAPPRLDAIGGRPPDLINPPPGCGFAPRCRYADEPLPQPAACAGRRRPRTSACMASADPGGRRMNAHSEVEAEGFLDVRDLTVEYPLAGGAQASTRSPASASRSAGARRWGWWAKAAAASPRPRARCCNCRDPTSGSVRLDGTELTSLRGGALQRGRRRFQMIFQDPDRLAEPAARGSGTWSRAPLDIAGERDEGRAHRSRGRDAGAGGPRPRPGDGAAPARVFGRPVPAHLHRPRADPASPSCWSATSRSRRSTSRCRRRS